MAARCGNLAAVEALIPVSATQLDSAGRSALMLAVLHRQIPIVRALIPHESRILTTWQQRLRAAPRLPLRRAPRRAPAPAARAPPAHEERTGHRMPQSGLRRRR
eukprot:gnl/Ergobibamus_cyprinoides/5812.p2 GENE.gnl/Ergobibamus_cyprinoides/5812~~gnl/Ergobibamus_cyprinoides/5812.p2  ORF type:complete len:111 (-),score=13.01 gnl/Ergobibamus_cyprinoides/5812:126-437(-)